MNEIKNLVEQLIELTGIHGASVVPIRYALFLSLRYSYRGFLAGQDGTFFALLYKR